MLTLITDTDRHSIRVPDDLRDKPVSDILRKENLPLNTRCGGRGICEGCLVELTHGTLVHLASGSTVTGNGHPMTLRGCEYKTRPGEPVTLHLPTRSMLRYAPQVVTTFRLNIPAGHNPLADDVKGGDVGVAIDVGTTTVAVMVVDLTDGKVLATASAFNRQMRLGDDVLTRINLCATDKSNIDALHHAIVEETIAPLIGEAFQQAAGSGQQAANQQGKTEQSSTPSSPLPAARCLLPANPRVVTISANTTMLHLFAKIDPTPMGTSPFTPVFLERRLADVKIPGIPADVPIHLLPGCSAYVGADLTAGIVATGMLYEDQTCLLVDIGTNGEIVLKHDGKLYGTATAAGPAFEGAGLTFGLRAGRGAISHIRIENDPFKITTEVIGGNVIPAGICGSAYVDFLAEGVKSGLLGMTGRIETPRTSGVPHVQKSQGIGPGKPSHVGEVGPWDQHGRAICVALGQGKSPVVISELDVSKLLQAKAAIAAGILTLLRRAGIEPKDVKTLYLAGGFGMHIDRAAAIASGLLPGFTPEQIQVVGNTSLGGAYLSLLDRGLMADFDRATQHIEIIELNLDPDFENCYIDQLMLG